MKNKLLLFIFLFITSFCFSQPANDDCSGAISLGTLPTPPPCGNGLQNGATTTVATTNVAATPEVPYVTLVGCGMASPANSVWYTFVVPPMGYGVVITVAGATFANPNIALWQGSNCNALTGFGCIVGAAGTATLNVGSGMVVGNTYYIQISGNTGQSGTFNLSVHAYQDCGNCLNAATLTVNPLPINGTYQPGQVVSFCFHIDLYTQIGQNWLHGIQLTFGPGWSLPSLVTFPPPFLLDNAGTWSYYPAGITSSANGTFWPAGFYFDDALFDGDPGNNFGDGALGLAGIVITPSAADWNFCWNVTVLSGCNPGMSLAMSVNTSGDGESGSWTSVGCASDNTTSVSAMISCCPPNMAATSTCTGQTTGTATASPVGAAGPYVYSWAPGGQNTQTATNLAAGPYVVTVTDANLCTATANVTVLADPVPTVNAVANFTPCAGDAVAIPPFTSPLAGTTFAWTNSNPTIGLAANGVGSIAGFNATNAGTLPISGTITVTPTSAPPASCVGTPINFTITVTPPPTVATAGPDQTVCGTVATLAGNAATVGTGTWTLISGTGTITTPSSPTSGITGLGAGANVFQWTITNPPCPATNDQVTITGGVTANAANAGPNQVICGTTATMAGNAAGAGVGTWTLISGAGTITSPNLETSGITGLGAGANVFQWTITAPPCLPTSAQVTIDVTLPPTLASAGVNQIVCGTVATLQGNQAVVGTGTWTLISGAGTITSPNLFNSGITGLGVGANVFQWSIANLGCPPTSSQVTITGVAPPTIAAAGGPQIICANTATLAGNTATIGTGLWTLISGSGTITTPAFEGTTVTGLGIGANVFQWTISNAPCPATSSQVTITSVANPTVAAAGPNQLICGGATQLAGNQAVIGTGTWTLISGSGVITNPALYNSGLTGLGVGANVFQWTITNAPCPATSSQVTITEGAPPTVSNAGPNQIVCGLTATMAANQALVGTGLWTLISGSGNITTPTSEITGITGLGVGPNVFQWTISNLPCPPSSSQVTITGGAIPTVANAGIAQTVCGTSATLAGNTATVGVGTWTLISGTGIITSPNSENTGVTGLSVGPNVFQWTIALLPCPPTSSQVTITGVAPPTVAVAGPDQTVCGPLAVLGANIPTIGVGTWSLVSGTGAITNAAVSNSGVSGLSFGPNVFQWTITNPICPPSTAQVTITQIPATTVSNAGPNQSICIDNPTTTLAGNPALVGVGTWSLVSGTGFITNPAASNTGVTGLSLGPNIFQWTITNLPCPPSTSQVVITVLPLPIVSVTSPTICTGQIANITASGGTTYTWSVGTNVTGVNTASAMPAATSTYTVTGTTFGCSSTAVSTVTVNPLPTAVISGGGSVCAGTTPPPIIITMTGTGPWSITYAISGVNASVVAGLSPYIMNNPAAGIYTMVSVTDANCTGNTSGSATVTINPIPAPSFTANPLSGCVPVCVQFTNTSSIASGSIASYSWDFGDGNTSGGQDPNYCYIYPGVFDVVLTATSAANCTATDTMNNLVTVYAYPTALFSCPPTATIYNPTIHFTDHSLGAISWDWDFGDPGTPNNTSNVQNPNHTYTHEGTYCATLTVSNGHCIDTNEICVIIEPEFTFYIPNAFSPNGDGKNDEFFGKGEGIDSYEMWIFDRWGNTVFYGDHLINHWDGTLHGHTVQEDVCVYVVKLTDFRQEFHKYIGSVTVVK